MYELLEATGLMVLSKGHIKELIENSNKKVFFF